VVILTDYFCTDAVSTELETKADGKKRYFVTGYASYTGIDKVNDFVSNDCLKDMESQLLNQKIKIGLEHDVAFAKDMRLLPYGTTVEGHFDGTGLMIKAELNDAHPAFANVWGSIEGHHLDAFSIEYKPIDYTFVKGADGKQIRILNKVQLGGIALTGRPANTDCKVTDFFVKSLSAQQKDVIAEIHSKSEVGPHPAPIISEVKTMETPAVEIPKTEVTAPISEVKVEPKVEVKTDNTELMEMKSALLASQKKIEELEKKSNEKMEIKTMLKEALKDLVPESKSWTAVDEAKKKELETKTFNAIPTGDFDTKSMIQAKFGTPRY